MGMTSGLQSQLGLSAETTIGTRVAPSRFFEYVSESMQFHRSRIESRGLRAGRRTLHRWAAGTGYVDGGFEMEMCAQSTALLLKHIIGGTDTITGTNPYVHTMTVGALDTLGMTIQINRPDISGTDRVFEYTGCQFTDAELTADIDQYLMLSANVYGMAESTSQTLATATYAASTSPFVFTQGSVTVAGTAFDVKKCNIRIDNKLATGRHQIRATTPEQPKASKEEGLREITGTLSADFTDLTAYTRFTAGTEAALVYTFTQGASAILTVTMNVRFDGTTPNIGGQQLVDLELPWKAVSGTSDAAAFTAVLTNADAAS